MLDYNMALAQARQQLTGLPNKHKRKQQHLTAPCDLCWHGRLMASMDNSDKANELNGFDLTASANDQQYAADSKVGSVGGSSKQVQTSLGTKSTAFNSIIWLTLTMLIFTLPHYLLMSANQMLVWHAIANTKETDMSTDQQPFAATATNIGFVDWSKRSNYTEIFNWLMRVVLDQSTDQQQQQSDQSHLSSSSSSYDSTSLDETLRSSSILFSCLCCLMFLCMVPLNAWLYGVRSRSLKAAIRMILKRYVSRKQANIEIDQRHRSMSSLRSAAPVPQQPQQSHLAGDGCQHCQGHHCAASTGSSHAHLLAIAAAERDNLVGLADVPLTARAGPIAPVPWRRCTSFTTTPNQARPRRSSVGTGDVLSADLHGIQSQQATRKLSIDANDSGLGSTGDNLAPSTICGAGEHNPLKMSGRRVSQIKFLVDAESTSENDPRKQSDKLDIGYSSSRDTSLMSSLAGSSRSLLSASIQSSQSAAYLLLNSTTNAQHRLMGTESDCSGIIEKTKDAKLEPLASAFDCTGAEQAEVFEGKDKAESGSSSPKTTIAAPLTLEACLKAPNAVIAVGLPHLSTASDRSSVKSPALSTGDTCQVTASGNDGGTTRINLLGKSTSHIRFFVTSEDQDDEAFSEVPQDNIERRFSLEPRPSGAINYNQDEVSRSARRQADESDSEDDNGIGRVIEARRLIPEAADDAKQSCSESTMACQLVRSQRMSFTADTDTKPVDSCATAPNWKEGPDNNKPDQSVDSTRLLDWCRQVKHRLVSLLSTSQQSQPNRSVCSPVERPASSNSCRSERPMNDGPLVSPPIRHHSLHSHHHNTHYHSQLQRRRSNGAESSTSRSGDLGAKLCCVYHRPEASARRNDSFASVSTCSLSPSGNLEMIDNAAANLQSAEQQSAHLKPPNSLKLLFEPKVSLYTSNPALSPIREGSTNHSYASSQSSLSNRDSVSNTNAANNSQSSTAPVHLTTTNNDQPEKHQQQAASTALRDQ